MFRYWESLENGFKIQINFLICQFSYILCFFFGKVYLLIDIYSLLSKIIKFFDLFNRVSIFLFSIGLVLVLLSFENMTNTNTILTVGIVFQYNKSRIVHLWFFQMTFRTVILKLLSKMYLHTFY